jgi:precorrin-4/cobalt-precorrin-4 C11-methyltransferase
MTVLVLVGEALRDDAPPARSHLYSPSFAHTYRKRSSPGATTGRPTKRRR